MNQGWVKLHRSIEENPMYFEESFTRAQAWMDLVLFANHKEGTVRIRGNLIKVKRGQTAWSEVTMAKRWKWSRNKVRRFLKELKNEQQIEQQKDRYITSLTTILNYEKYQCDTTDDTTERQQKDSRRNINKNDKNEKNNTTTPNSTEKAFEPLWLKYPKKLGKKQSLRHFKATVKNEKDLQDINTALDNYIDWAKDKEEQYIKHGSSWFNNWQDWVTYGKESVTVTNEMMEIL